LYNGGKGIDKYPSIRKCLAVGIITLFLGSGITSAISGQTKTLSKNLGDSNTLTRNILDPKDEGDHFPCGCEWWWVGALLTLENGTQWDVSLTFTYFMNRTQQGYDPFLSFYRVQCLDEESGKSYDFLRKDAFPNTVFNFRKNMVDINYNNCTIKGLFPDYAIQGEDTKNNISFNLRYHSESNPYWVLNESTGGLIPWGVSGTFRYYFILRNSVTGNISMNGSCYNVTGVGYYEHQFGDIDLLHFLKIYSMKELRDNTMLYSQLLRWSRTEVATNKRLPLQSIHFSTDSFGWDAIWATFDNGYSMIFGIVRMFGLINGRSLGPMLALTDGKNSWEFGDVYLDFKKTLYIEDSDIYIPLNLEITAYKGNKTLHLILNNTVKNTQLFHNKGNELGNFLVPSIANGYLIDGEKNITLNGVGGNNPGCFIPKIKYRSLDIDLLLPPHGFGISIKKVSHRSGLERFFELQLKPTFKFIYYIKPVPDV
jgi:hypothetical protein